MDEGDILDLSFFVVPEEKRVFAVTIYLTRGPETPAWLPDAITLDAFKSMPVLKLKTAIETRTKIPWDRQKLVHNGVELDTVKTLEDYQIVDEPVSIQLYQLTQRDVQCTAAASGARGKGTKRCR